MTSHNADQMSPACTIYVDNTAVDVVALYRQHGYDGRLPPVLTITGALLKSCANVPANYGIARWPACGEPSIADAEAAAVKHGYRFGAWPPATT